MLSKFKIGDKVVINFRWDAFVLDGTLKIGTITGFNKNPITSLYGRTFEPGTFAVAEDDQGNIYSENPTNGRFADSFSSYKEMESTMDYIEGQLNNRLKALTELRMDIQELKDKDA